MFAASLHRISPRTATHLGRAGLLVTAITLLLTSLCFAAPASAEPSGEVKVARYTLSFGPETQRGANGRWDRDYLAQIRFRTSRQNKTTTTTQRNQLERPFAKPFDALAEENAKLALGQVIALESELWKRARPGDEIADNRFVELPRSTGTARNTEFVYGPQPLLSPPALSAVHASPALLAACKAETVPAVTVALLSPRQPSQARQSEERSIQVTPAQDQSQKPC